MPQFFFHFDEGGKLSRDEMGLNFPSTEQAYLEAFAAARAMWSELLHERKNPAECAFEVTDDADVPVFRLAFTEVLDICKREEARPATNPELLNTFQETHRKVRAAKLDFQKSLEEVHRKLAEWNGLLQELSQLERDMSGLRACPPDAWDETDQFRTSTGFSARAGSRPS